MLLRCGYCSILPVFLFGRDGWMDGWVFVIAPRLCVCRYVVFVVVWNEEICGIHCSIKRIRAVSSVV